MPKVKSVDMEGRVQQIMYINKTVLMKLKAYGIETGTPFHKLIANESKIFDDLLLAKCESIDKLRMEEYESYLREKEARELAEQNPMPVAGHEVDPIGKTEIEPISI